MRKSVAIIAAVLCVGVDAHPAFANTGPGPLFGFVFLAAWLLIPVMVLLTMAGGGYAIRARLRGTRPRRWHSVLRVCAALGVVVSGTIIFFTKFFGTIGGLILVAGYFLGLIVLVGIALYRGVQLLRWGWLARARARAPEHLAAANPWRLLPAGGLLLLVVIFLTGYILNPPLSTSAKIRRAESGTKTAVTQGIVYSNDKNRNPGNMANLRNDGYANIRDKDPWGRDWVYSPAFADTAAPANEGELYVYSKGPRGTGTYPIPFTSNTGKDGSIGYSSRYGAWRGDYDY